MTRYNVHLYREMRLVYEGIEATSHEGAAAIARNRLTEDADDIAACDGETFAALVDIAGDKQHEQSRMIDFEDERLRKAAPLLLAALKACEVQLREYVDWHHAHAGGCSVEIEDAWEQARAAIAAAITAGREEEAV
jgi:hypothetical protein